MDRKALDESDIMEVFERLGLKTHDDRDKFLRLEKLGTAKVFTERVGEPVEILSGGPAEIAILQRDILSQCQTGAKSLKK